MIMSATSGIEGLEIFEICSETKILGIAWMRETIVEQRTETQTAWNIYVMAVRNYGRLVTLVHGGCMRTPTRMIEMI
jgi:hypothetical protein